MRMRWTWSLSLLVPWAANAQNIDSLRSAWADPVLPDSARYSAGFDLCQAYLYVLPDSSLHYARALERFTRRSGMERAHRSAINLVGNAHKELGHSDSALAIYDRVLVLSTSAGDPALAASAMGNRGSVRLSMGRADEGLFDLEEALKLAQQAGRNDLATAIMNNIALINESLGRYMVAITWYDRTVRALDTLGQEVMSAQVMSNLALMYKRLGDNTKAEALYREAIGRLERNGERSWRATALMNLGALLHEEGRKPAAVELWQQAVTLLHGQEGTREYGQLLVNLGVAHQEAGRTDTAMVLFEQAMRSAVAHQDVQQQAAAGHAMAEWWYHRNDIRKAITMAEQALAWARSVPDPENMDKLLLFLQARYAETGDLRMAHRMAADLLALRDSTKTADEQRALLRSEYQHANDRRALSDSLSFAAEAAVKNKEIQKQKVIRNGFVGGFALVALFAIVFFTQRNRISREKARSEALLLNILPEEVAEELKQKGEAQAVQIDQVTVLFTDFKGFTSLSENLTPRELVRDLNECFSAFDRITEKYGIEKIKTIGDAYMAAGGLPVANATHAVDTIKAALEMRDFIEEGKQRKIAAGKPYFEVRIGVHSGPVVAGIVGVKKFQYDIWGDTVNTASRMESSGEVGKVNISEATYRLVAGPQLSAGGPGDGSRTTDNQQVTTPAFTFTPRGKVQAKGKGAMEMFFVERA